MPATIAPSTSMMAQSRAGGQREDLHSSGTRQANAIEYLSIATASASFSCTTNRIPTSCAPLAMLESVAATAASPGTDRDMVIKLCGLAKLDRELTDCTGIGIRAPRLREPSQMEAWTCYDLHRLARSHSHRGFDERTYHQKNSLTSHLIHLPTLAVSDGTVTGNLAMMACPGTWETTQCESVTHLLYRTARPAVRRPRSSCICNPR